jgi:hypothetical protein
MRRPRNPRRAYDANGREIPPATLGYLRKNDRRTVEASCHECQHSSVVNVDTFPNSFPVPDVALKLRCSACGSKHVTTTLNMKEHYEAMHRATGWSAGQS